MFTVYRFPLSVLLLKEKNKSFELLQGTANVLIYRIIYVEFPGGNEDLLLPAII